MAAASSGASAKGRPRQPVEAEGSSGPPGSDWPAAAARPASGRSARPWDEVQWLSSAQQGRASRPGSRPPLVASPTCIQEAGLSRGRPHPPARRRLPHPHAGSTRVQEMQSTRPARAAGPDRPAARAATCAGQPEQPSAARGGFSATGPAGALQPEGQVSSSRAKPTTLSSPGAGKTAAAPESEAGQQGMVTAARQVRPALPAQSPGRRSQA